MCASYRLTRGCRRRQTASAPASLPLFAAPDPWRSASRSKEDHEPLRRHQDVATLLTSQEDDVMHCIAFLGPTASAPTSTSTTQPDVLRKALAEFGLVEGRNIVIDSQ